MSGIIGYDDLRATVRQVSQLMAAAAIAAPQTLALLMPQRGGMPGEGVADLELIAAQARVIDFQRPARRAARQAHHP